MGQFIAIDDFFQCLVIIITSSEFDLTPVSLPF